MILPPHHLAFLLPTLHAGGAERTILKLAGGFCNSGYMVDLVLVHKVGSLISEIPPQVNLFDLNAPRRFSSRALSSLPKLVTYLRNVRPDILYTGLMTNLIALWAKKLANVPTHIVVSERNVLSEEINQFPHDFRFRMLPTMVRLFYPWADRIVAVSRAVADDLMQVGRIPLEKISVINNPVVTLSLQIKSEQPLNHPWFMPGEPPVVLAVGRLAPQKDYPTLLKAFARVHREHPLHLLILGEGDSRGELELLAKELGIMDDVQFAGYTENPYPYMRRCAVFVLSSRFEGLPGVLVEALYCKARVIATDCPGGSREVLADGKYGLLVPVGDAVEMACAMEKCLDGGIDPPGEESWQPYHIENVMSQYIQLFTSISAGNKQLVN